MMDGNNNSSHLGSAPPMNCRTENITEQITKGIPRNIRNMTYSFTRFLFFSAIPKIASRERGKSTMMKCDEIKIKQMTLNTGEIFSSFFRIRTMLEMIKNMPKVMEMEIMEMSRILSLSKLFIRILLILFKALSVSLLLAYRILS